MDIECDTGFVSTPTVIFHADTAFRYQLIHGKEVVFDGIFNGETDKYKVDSTLVDIDSVEVFDVKKEKAKLEAIQDKNFQYAYDDAW